LNQKEKKLNIVFCGTAEIAIPTLELLANHPRVNLLKIISMPDRPAGRSLQLKSPAVAEFAKNHNLPLFQTANINQEDDLYRELKSLTFDVLFVFAFAQFFGKKFLELAEIGPFNVHTSLLPKYRGAAPIQYALLNGDSYSGISIQKITEKMDAGDLVLSHQVEIDPRDNAGSLHDKLQLEAVSCTEEFLVKVLNNRLTLTPQDESKASFAPSLKKEDGFIDFKTQTKTAILNKLRALSPWPGIYFFLNNKRLKILEMTLEKTKVVAGEINVDFGTLLVGSRDGTLRLTKVQAEGKKPYSDKDFLNGLQKNIKNSLALTKN